MAAPKDGFPGDTGQGLVNISCVCAHHVNIVLPSQADKKRPKPCLCECLISMQNKENFLPVAPPVSLFVTALLSLSPAPVLLHALCSLALMVVGDGAPGCGSQPVPVLQFPRGAQGQLLQL